MKLNKLTIINTSKEIFIKNKVSQAYLFGSYAKEQNNNASDIDFILDIGDNLDIEDLIKIANIKEQLEKAFNKEIDLVISPSKIFFEKNKNSIIPII
jgi:predicted nucleotidyltransferase